jgi:hypothetical protein
VRGSDGRGVESRDRWQPVDRGGHRWVEDAGSVSIREQPDAATLAAHDPSTLGPEEIRVGDPTVYQWCPNGILAAPDVSAFVEKRWKVAVTACNWNTVTRLSALLQQA